MTDHPIIFSGPMVRALLDGRKTMTRRLAWRTKWNDGGHIPDGGGGQMDFVEPHEVRIGPSPWQKVKPGDRLWVRENWNVARYSLDYETGGEESYFEWEKDFGDPREYLNREARGGMAATLHFAADGDDGNPAEFCECWSIDGKKRLREREIPWRPSIHMPRWASRLTLVVRAVKVERLNSITYIDAKAEGTAFVPGHEDPRDEFAKLWESLHGKGSWITNSEVVALTFVVHAHNIDTLPRTARE